MVKYKYICPIILLIYEGFVSFMKFEHVSKKALIMWEILAILILFVAVALVILIFTPRTWLWYTLLIALGAIYIFEAFLHLPLYYLNLEFCLTDDGFILRHGVFYPSTNILYRDRIVFVTVYQNPLTPLLKISSLKISAAGATTGINFISTNRAKELANLLSAPKDKFEL